MKSQILNYGCLFWKELHFFFFLLSVLIGNPSVTLIQGFYGACCHKQIGREDSFGNEEHPP